MAFSFYIANTKNLTVMKARVFSLDMLIIRVLMIGIMMAAVLL